MKALVVQNFLTFRHPVFEGSGTILLLSNRTRIWSFKGRHGSKPPPSVDFLGTFIQRRSQLIHLAVWSLINSELILATTLPVPDCLHLCATSTAQVPGERASSSQEKTRTARNFRDNENAFQPACLTHDTCTRLPPQPSPKCRSPSFMGENTNVATNTTNCDIFCKIHNHSQVKHNHRSSSYSQETAKFRHPLSEKRMFTFRFHLRLQVDCPENQPYLGVVLGCVAPLPRP